MAKETAASIFTADATFPAIDATPNTALPDPKLVSLVYGLTIASGTAYLITRADGSVAARARISWTAIADEAVREGGQVQVQFRRAALAAAPWETITVPGTAREAYVDAVAEGEILIVRARARNSLVFGQWSTHQRHQIVGKTQAPADVSGYTATTVSNGIRLKWNDNSVEADYGYTEIRRGASWAVGASDVIFSGRADRWTMLEPADGHYTLWAKHFDSSGNESAAAQVQDFDFTLTGGIVAALSLVATSSVIKLDQLGAPTPTSITFTALGSFPGDPVFTVVDGSGTLTGTGTARSMTVASMGAAESVTVQATWGGQTDLLTAVKVRDGADAFIWILTNEAVTVPADAGGVVASFAAAAGAFRVFLGAVEVTGLCAFSVVSATGVTVAINPTSGLYSVDAMSADVGFATLRAIYAGNNLDRIFSIAKARAGVAGSAGPALFTLNPRGGAAVGPTDAVHRATGGGAWDADAYSSEAYVGGCFVSFSVAAMGTVQMAGLNSDPTTDTSYASIDYAWYPEGAVAHIYESGGHVATFGSYTTDSIFSIVYDGQEIKYLIDGTVLRTVSTTANRRFYFDSSIYSNLGGINRIRFGPMGARGLQGPQGNEGIEGPPGPDGQTNYFHVAYAYSSDGTAGFNNSAGPYIGTYSDYIITDSGNPGDYVWRQFVGAQGPQGDQGIPGSTGPNGQTSYLHIKYSNDGGASFTSSGGEDPGAWIGTYVDFTAGDSVNVAAYTWARMQPPNYRQEGDPGAVQEGATWTIPSTGKSYIRQAGSWIPYVGSLSVGTGELADQAATEISSQTYDFHVISGIDAIGYTILTHELSQGTFEITVSTRAKCVASAGDNVFRLNLETVGSIAFTSSPNIERFVPTGGQHEFTLVGSMVVTCTGAGPFFLTVKPDYKYLFSGTFGATALLYSTNIISAKIKK